MPSNKRDRAEQEHNVKALQKLNPTLTQRREKPISKSVAVKQWAAIVLDGLSSERVRVEFFRFRLTRAEAREELRKAKERARVHAPRWVDEMMFFVARIYQGKD